YVFPLFKISYMWFSTIGAMTTLIVGYLASYFSVTKPSHLEGHLLNPIARKLFLKEEKCKKDILLPEIHSASTGIQIKNEKECANGVPLLRGVET
ncbi:hypothetical protein CEXT_39531, partial [Caerostris extrusa]